MIKVGFDISQIIYQGGVGIYTRELAKALIETDLDIEFVFFGSSLRSFNDLSKWRNEFGKKARFKFYPFPQTLLEMLWNRFHLFQVENLIGKVDVFHSSDWIQPPSKAKKVTTCHDLVPLIYPKWSHPKIVEVHKRKLKLVEREVDLVICVSDATRNDLLEVSSIPKEKMVVIYEGVGEQFKPKDAGIVEDFKKELDLPGEFVLAIGGVGERRNLKRVKEASEKYNLVIAGVDIPWIPYEKLPLLYSSAKVLLYPSLYEGFGLPILEAMACGTPVITSSVSSMPEAGGDGAEYVNPESVIDIENKLKKVWEDGEKRKVMIKKGFVQAKKFSWEKAAKETSGVYFRLVG